MYNNEYSSIIDVYFYATLSTQTLSACTPKTFLDALSDILGKRWRFSLIKIESVSETQAKYPWFPSLICCIYFSIKMLSLVLIKNCNSCVYLICILSNKLDLNQETRFIIGILIKSEVWMLLF